MRPLITTQTTLNTHHSLHNSITDFGDVGVDDVTFCSSYQGRRESRGFLMKIFLPHKNFADDGFFARDGEHNEAWMLLPEVIADLSECIL